MKKDRAIIRTVLWEGQEAPPRESLFPESVLGSISSDYVLEARK